MTPPTFHIGDQVEIVGPTITGCKLHLGETFTITQSCGGNYSSNGFPWYPASSLRLVEELKIGDWVEVVGRPKGMSEYPIGQIGKITDIGPQGGFWVENVMKFYDSSALRKLTPDEIEQHLAPPINTPQNQFNEKVDRRLAAIERRQGAQQNRMDAIVSNAYDDQDELEKRLSEINKRLDFIEAFQKDAAIHATYMTYTYKPGEEGTITVHCPCGRKHEIEATPRAYQDDDMIDITILRRADRTLHMWHSRDPDECLDWAKRVMDEMRTRS